jgi:hypothetical protein
MMEGVVNGAYLCNTERTTELSDRMYARNIPSRQLMMTYGPRAVPTRYVMMPVEDCRKTPDVQCLSEPNYSTRINFSPGNSLPFDGFQNNVDTESKLKNIIFPLQKAGQSKFIPDSKSDLFNSQYLTRTNNKVNMTNKLLFSKQKFNQFNPNTQNIGYKYFNNHTRVQIKATISDNC